MPGVRRLEGDGDVALSALVGMSIDTADIRAFSGDDAKFCDANFPVLAGAFVVYSSRAVAPLLLDTGPPGAFSFAELILQQSLLAHAPPVLV